MRIVIIHIGLILCLFSSCKKQEIIVLDVLNENLYLNNGVLEFINKPFNGKIQSSFSNGQLKSEVIYLKGKKQGIEKIWYANGELEVERNYYKGIKVGIHKAWWQNGTPKFLYHFNEKGEYHGNVKEWYADGILFKDFNYENGKEKGGQRLWKPDGNIKSNYEVVNGERFGLIGLKKCYTVTTDSDEIK
ncbi:hypothetical protein N1F78_10440 [Seonamhaeicola sp. MEBiC1930]|uniref:toxin-antitoxin system YwqK family antitoxin n=1 Tax=Seonamhaeicola sp. MEBiC01930 TaxID=2976768 RepID=UPI003248EFEE